MNRYLADALRTPAEDWIPDIFYERFQTANQWRDFIIANFPNGLSSILDARRGWKVSDFQALYIACWMYKPVVKGSYMIKLSDQQADNARHAYKKKLSSRWTSHLHGPTTKGADASNGWRFLRGYHELLVQIEEARDGTYLFLKCEGHPAVSIAHIKSYRHKKKHGVGLDVNGDLLMLASDEDRHLGIKVRAAENYGPNYKALIQQLGFRKLIKKKGEIVDTRLAAAMLLNAVWAEARADDHLLQWLNQKLLTRGIRIRMRSGLPEDAFADAENGKVSHVFRVLSQFPNKALQYLGGNYCNQVQFLAALSRARRDLEGIANQLQRDQNRGNPNTVRYFQEVVVVPFDVDMGIQKALDLLDRHKGSDI